MPLGAVNGICTRLLSRWAVIKQPARAKMFDLTYDDAIAFARDNGIRKPESIIRSVADVLRNFRPLATQNHVREEWIGRVEQTIHEHLVAWRLVEDTQ